MTRRLTIAFGDEVDRKAVGLALSGAGIDAVLEDPEDHTSARAAQIRDEILAIVSHDLRNPLNAISLASQELGDPDLPATSRTKYVGAIVRAITRAERLIRDLLDASLIDSGRLTVEQREMSIRALLEQVAKDQRSAAERSKMTIRVAVDDASATVFADRERIQQVLENLIGNVFRHAGGSDEILIGAMTRADKIRIFVSDHGPGISAEVKPHVFDRYWQGKAARRSGAGLGLAIVKGVVEAHGGAMGVDSEPGQGATFWFELSRGRANVP